MRLIIDSPYEIPIGSSLYGGAICNCRDVFTKFNRVKPVFLEFESFKFLLICTKFIDHFIDIHCLLPLFITHLQYIIMRVIKR